MTFHQDKLLDEGRETWQRLEDALKRGDLDDAQIQCDKARTIARHISDEIFQIRIQQWDDHLRDYVETK